MIFCHVNKMARWKIVAEIHIVKGLLHIMYKDDIIINVINEIA